MTRLALGVEVETKVLLNIDLVRYIDMKTMRRIGRNLLSRLLDIWLGMRSMFGERAEQALLVLHKQ